MHRFQKRDPAGVRRAWQPSGPPPVAERCTCAKLGFARSGGAEAELRAVRVAIGSSISKRQSSRLRTAADSPGRSVLYSRISRSFSPPPGSERRARLTAVGVSGRCAPSGLPAGRCPRSGICGNPGTARRGPAAAAPEQGKAGRAAEGRL